MRASHEVHLDDGISAAQDAVLRVQSRILRSSPDSKQKTVSSRLLVPSNQVGCLLGKGGAIMVEMRKISSAYIRILRKEQITKRALENERVVQVPNSLGLLCLFILLYLMFDCLLFWINGEFDAVQEAAIQITSRLRHHLFRDKFPAMNYPPNSTFPDQGADSPVR
ncbi:hypothetical protein ACLOJK_003994 [Asimina triloba]